MEEDEIHEFVPSEMNLCHPYVKASLSYEDTLEVEIDGSAQSSILLADYFWAHNKPEAAKQILNKIESNKDWAKLYIEGLLYLIDGDLPNSYDIYDKIDDVFAANRAVDIAFWQGDSSKMLSASQKLDSKVTTHPFAGGVRAFALHVMGHHEQAEKVANDAIKHGFCDPWTVHAVAHVMYSEGRLQDCIDWIGKYRDVPKSCGSFMRGHFAFHEALCHVDFEDVPGVTNMLQGSLWDTQSKSDQEDYWNATCILNVLWKCELRGLKAPFEYADKALENLTDYDAGKSKVFSLCILKWKASELANILSVEDEILSAFANAVYSAYFGKGWQDAYSFLMPHLDSIHLLGASPEQREVIIEFVGLCLLKVGASEQLQKWSRNHIRPNVKFYQQFVQ